MTAVSQTRRLSVEDYLAWSESQAGRYELVDGLVVAQAAERAAHAEVKGAVYVALRDAIAAHGLPCRVLPDGMAVRIDAATVYEPDAQVYCGPRLEAGALLVENPVIVVEVLSPSTGRNDAGRKLAGYFGLPSVAHYLIVDPDEMLVIHHQRAEDGRVSTSFLRDGAVNFDPPGLAIELARIYDT